MHEILNSAIKPGPARRIDLRLSWLGSWTGPGKIKDRSMQQLGKTRSTHDPDKPGQDLIFFFKCDFSYSFFYIF
jgi:hypothetical protein